MTARFYGGNDLASEKSVALKIAEAVEMVGVLPALVTRRECSASCAFGMAEPRWPTVGEDCGDLTAFPVAWQLVVDEREYEAWPTPAVFYGEVCRRAFRTAEQ